MFYKCGRAGHKIRKRLLKGVLCSLLALSVFSNMPSVYAWHFIPWVYHLPSADPGIVQDDSGKFDWNKVKDTVNSGLDRLEAEERARYGRGGWYNLQDDFEGNDVYYNGYEASGGNGNASEHHEYHGSNYGYNDDYGWYDNNRYFGGYGVDKYYSNNGANYTWQSYIWDYEGGKQIISHFSFDTIGGTILTWRRYGEGDWVKERPPGWPYGDDFAMYSRLFESNIPIRDMEVRTGFDKINNYYLGDGDEGIVAMLDKVKTSVTGRNTTGILDGKQKYEALLSIALKGDLKDLVARLRDPKSLFQSVTVVIQSKQTSVNSEYPGFTGLSQGYNREDMEKGSDSPIIRDKEEFLRKTEKDIIELYEKSMEDNTKAREESDKVLASNSGEATESTVNAKTKEEMLRRQKLAMQKQREELDGVEQRHIETKAQLEDDRYAIIRSHMEAQTHMPTAKEFAKEIREKRAKYSTSHDLGYRKFGQGGKKADFSKILEHAIDPKFGEEEQ